MNKETNLSFQGPIAWMIKNPVASNLLMIVLLVGGFISFRLIKQEVFPDFEMGMVNISVAYPGASPEEIEQGILLSTEEAVRGIEGIKVVNSYAREGVGSVVCELEEGSNEQRIYQDIQQEVDRISTYPVDAEEPQVSISLRRREVVNVVLFGDIDERYLRDMAETLRSYLLAESDISQVDLAGVRDMEISIEIPFASLREHKLSLAAIASLIGSCALEIPGGGLKTNDGEVLVRLKDRRDFGFQFADIPLKESESGQLYLKDIAVIKDSFADTDRYAYYNGKPAIGLDIYRTGNETPIQVAAAVRKVIKEFKRELPAGVDVAVRNDRSIIFRQRAELLLRNGFIGLVLVILLLGVFLEFKLAFWVMMGIPISFLGAMVFLPMMGVSINMISMFAFLIALGIVVDDAIVVGENIYEYHMRGFSFKEAALKGTTEVLHPVTFSVLTNMVTFCPLFFVPGFIGKIWKVIPSVVILTFFISLIECAFVLPSHLAYQKVKRATKPGRWIHERQQLFSKWFSDLIKNYYTPFLQFILTHRYLVLSMAAAVLILIFSWVQSGRIRMVPMPRVESDYSVVTAVLPYGSPLEKTQEVMKHITDASFAVAAEQGGDKLVEGVFSRIGKSYKSVSGSHVLEVRTFLTDPEIRPISTKEFTKKWREKVGDIKNLEALIFESDRGGPGSGVSFTMDLSHDDPLILEKACQEAAVFLGQFSVVKDIDDGVNDGKVQYDFHLLPQARNFGLTAVDIGRQVRNAFYGTEALRQQRGRNEVKVTVRLPENEREDINNIYDFLIINNQGSFAPLRELVSAEKGYAYTSIDRRDGMRIMTVTANVEPNDQTGMIEKKVIEELIPALKAKYPEIKYSFEGKQKDMADSMKTLKAGFLISMLIIYALLAIPFKSYLQPFIVMVSIPFGMVGAVLGHMLMGYSLSIMSLMGLVALSGVVVNDSLVFIDFANRELDAGLSPREALLSAGTRRFRPIMLTTLTTFGGLAPMIFETSRQARFLIPMALSLGYGILFATVITLIIVPSLFLIFNDIKIFLNRVKKTHDA